MKIQEQFDYVYNEYSKCLFNIAYGYLKDKEDSADVIQTVFLKALDKNINFKTYDDIKYYLIRITINCCLDVLKSAYKKKVVLNNEIVLNFNNPNNYLNEDSSNLDLINSIDCLNDKYKTVIILRYYDLMSINEIAKTLKISVDATKKRLERAKKMIKTLMERN